MKPFLWTFLNIGHNNRPSLTSMFEQYSSYWNVREMIPRPLYIRALSPSWTIQLNCKLQVFVWLFQVNDCFKLLCRFDCTYSTSGKSDKCDTSYVSLVCYSQRYDWDLRLNSLLAVTYVSSTLFLVCTWLPILQVAICNKSNTSIMKPLLVDILKVRRHNPPSDLFTSKSLIHTSFQT